MPWLALVVHVHYARSRRWQGARETTVIQRVLAPYLTGKGLPGRAHRVVALPTQAQLQRVLANMMC